MWYKKFKQKKQLKFLTPLDNLFLKKSKRLKMFQIYKILIIFATFKSLFCEPFDKLLTSGNNVIFTNFE